MIRPELANAPGAPRAIREAYESWMFFKQSAEVAVPGLDGIRVIHVGHDKLTKDFLTRLLIKGGTDRDIRWLVQFGIMSGADVYLWDEVVSEFAACSLEEEDAE